MLDSYDAILFLSFGGPEGPDDVLPFLENVLRGKRVPRERMLEVAEHYYQFGGISPINAQVRELMAAVQVELHKRGIDLPIFWGNRNWHPLLSDTLQEMADQGIRKVLTWVTSAYSSYSGCRQYLEDIEKARSVVGENSPQIDKLRVFFNHPSFIEAQADRIRRALDACRADSTSLRTTDDQESDLADTWLLFTAHSIPDSMAANCDYVAQLEETCRLVADAVGHDRWRLVYQSRSGPPNQPWLEPDICDAIQELHANEGRSKVVIAPIGFLSDHLEVLYDLDIEARNLCADLGVAMVRAETVGTHPKFVSMIADLFVERLNPESPRLAIGRYGPRPDTCPLGCCAAPLWRSAKPAS